MAWLRTNPIQELVEILEFAADNSRDFGLTAEKWRWLILSLHLGVQAALICALKGYDTSGTSILSAPSARQTLDWLHTDPKQRGQAPNQQLAPMRNLLKRAQQPSYLPDPYRLTLPQHKIDDVLRLNELRNQFVHFAVDGWSLDADGLPRIAMHSIEVIEHLTLTAPAFWHQLEAGDTERIAKALAVVKERLRSYESNKTQAVT